MKQKSNMIKGIIILIIILVAIVLGYFTYQCFHQDEVNQPNTTTTMTMDRMEEEIIKIKDTLGWLVIHSGIQHQISLETLGIMTDIDLFNTSLYRQLFTMEYIINHGDITKFVILDNNFNKLEGDYTPREDTTLAYYPYEDFNKMYRYLFDETLDRIDINHGITDNEYDNRDDYVYYDNRHAGANGLLVTEIKVEDVQQRKNAYEASLTLVYSPRLSEWVGQDSNKAILRFGVKNDHLIFQSFVIEKN